jgi:hypothetical protein
MTDEIKEQAQYVQELLSTGIGTEGSLIIVKKIHDVMIEETDKALIPREMAALYIGPAMIPGSSYDLDLEQENKMDVRLISEGTEIWLDQDEYTSTNLKPKKYGIAVKITGEMREDSKWPLLERNVKKAAKRFAENETNLILTQLQGCTNNISGGSATTSANIARGIQYLNDADYEPTDLLIGPEVLNDLMNIDLFTEAHKAGDAEMLKRGYRGIIYGLRVSKFSANAAPSTTYSKYAYVIDRDNSYVIAEKRPITVENFKLPLFDMDGAAVTQRIVVSRLRDSATCRISTS